MGEVEQIIADTIKRIIVTDCGQQAHTCFTSFTLFAIRCLLDVWLMARHLPEAHPPSIGRIVCV